MKSRLRAAAAAACALLAAAPAARAQTPSPAPAAIHRESVVTTRASGTFEVKLTPQPTDAPGLGRMSIDKQFRGGLEGTSKGEMLAAMTGTEGSAGYVAMETVTGTLDGRTGTFVLQHSGTMIRGAPTLVVSVVPDSGTGGLVGLAGTMVINIGGGKHSYDFDYTLSAAR